MAENDSTENISRPTKIGRAQIGVNVIAQVLLVLGLAAMVNYLGLQHYKR